MALGAKITPVLRYRNPRTAARWLCEAFGFSEHHTAHDADGQVRYVVLQLAGSSVLVRPVADLGFDDLLVQPEAVGGANTQVCYVTVPDAEAHRARAEAAGAKIEIEPQDDGLGGHFYTCRDLEGHLWSFGTRTYGVADVNADQWEATAPASARRSTALTVIHPVRARRGALARSAAVAAALAVLVLGGWAAYQTYAGVGSVPAVQLEQAREELAREQRLRADAERASGDAAAKLAEQRTAAADVRQSLQRAQAELVRERQARDAAIAALAAAKPLAQKLEQAERRSLAELEAARGQAAREQARSAALAKSADERAALLQERIAKLQQDRAAEREDLKEARTALLAAQAELERLRAAKQEPKGGGADPAPGIVTGQYEAPKAGASRPPDARLAAVVPEASAAAGSEKLAEANASEAKSSDPKAPGPRSACASAVQGKVPFGRKASSTWAEADLARLCRGAETSLEPAKCFEELMRGKVNWGGGTVWTTSNALALCGGVRNARRTLDCFAARLAADDTWLDAIKQCRAPG